MAKATGRRQKGTMDTQLNGERRELDEQITW